jgi:metal-sulfur cluster biosynthetic enzyme
MNNNNAPKATRVAKAIETVWRALDGVKDPCNVLSGHDLSIVDMGLINSVETIDDGVEIGITFTEPGCLFGYRIIEDIEDLAATLPGVSQISVVPEPFPLWDESRLNLKAREVYAAKKAQFGQHRVSLQSIRATEELT